MIGDHYRQMEILTASPEALVARLTEAAIRHCRTAANDSGDDAERVAERGVAISKALAIVGELRGALDHERGGEIAVNLDALYVFVAGRLLDAHVTRNRAPIADAERVLAELHEGWAAIAGRATPEG